MRTKDGLTAKQRYDRDNKRTIVYIPNERYTDIEKRAKENDMSVSAWIKKAIDYYVEYLNELGV